MLKSYNFLWYPFILFAIIFLFFKNTYADPTTVSEINQKEETDSHALQDKNTRDDVPDSPQQIINPVSNSDSLVNLDVPIVINNAVEKSIKFFTYAIRDRFNLWLNRSERYLDLMREIIRDKEIPEDLVYLPLIESGFNPYAYSRAKASGPWQFIASTAKRYGLKINWWVDERRDPIKSTEAAALYLKDLYEMFGSWKLALAAYNAGERTVMKALTKTKADDFWKIRETRYIKRETKEYVPRYIAATIIAKDPQSFGFEVEPHEPFLFDEVVINTPTDLKVIAKAAGVSVEEIRELNPELKRWCTPPNHPEYKIRLPFGTKEEFLTNIEQIPENERLSGDFYTVKSGDTIKRITKKFSVSYKTIIEANAFTAGHVLSAGDRIFIPKKRLYAEMDNTKKKKKKKGRIT